MAPVTTDFEDLVAAWPAPVQLRHLEGDLFVTFIQNTNFIEAEWSGHITADDVVRAAQVYLALLQKTPVGGLLNNKAEASGDWVEANDWLEFEWLPKAVRAGLSCLAHIYSNNMFSMLSARDLLSRLSPRVRLSTFCEHDEAVSWLNSCLTAMDGETLPLPQA